VAKKKKTRKTASRGARKPSTSRRGARKTPTRARATGVETGLENPKRIVFTPLKRIITAQIKRLEDAEPRPDVEYALNMLRETKARLSNACRTTPIPMVIEF
jgi:hypothetical protein